jgi:hypothetical protein
MHLTSERSQSPLNTNISNPYCNPGTNSAPVIPDTTPSRMAPQPKPAPPLPPNVMEYVPLAESNPSCDTRKPVLFSGRAAFSPADNYTLVFSPSEGKWQS